MDCSVRLEEKDGDFAIAERLRSALPSKKKLDGAIVRMTIEYPRAWETLIDDAPLRAHAAGAFEFHLVKRPQMEARIRLPEGQAVGSMSPYELLGLFWDANHVASTEQAELARLAQQVIQQSTESDASLSSSEGTTGISSEDGDGQ
jgi:exonuclease SbcD